MKLIKGFDLPNESLSRNHNLIPKYDLAWRDWLQTTGKQFKNSIPTNGIVESIEKICSGNEYNRFVIIKGEVAFYKILLEYHSKNYIEIEPNEWDKLQDDDLICLSMPFSPIASIPDWYKTLCDYIENKNIYMFIDGAYLGTIKKKIHIPDNCILFATSISKCFNASALRAGILFYDKVPVLFKSKVLIKNYNYISMKKTIELLDKYDYYYTYNNYWHVQKMICAGWNLKAADSVLVGYDSDSRYCISDFHRNI